ncbi:tyrosine-type recombinase/integrase [Congregibacter litoralis]|uniref:Site-specific recombinase XerD n=1 Tax=Congregibacter litoralis KT71 TaxID=314285 RepID=A4AAD7_9GAMM|nr:site-specific integrase [Congregibacter litoralis]EAQ97014.1 Site-specific recombinase XerD [Congregibacter litoralis KT71]
MHSDGTVCWEATDYLLFYHFENPSGTKSTLEKYARQLSRIVAFLEYSSRWFDDITDDDLFDLPSFLQDSKNSGSGQASDNNQVNEILTRLLKVLVDLSARGYIDADKISFNPMVRADVNIEMRAFVPKGSKVKREYYYHPARLSTKNAQKRRPISDAALNTLHSKIYEFTENRFTRVRWANLLQALELTGARVSEVAKIHVVDVKRCLNEIEYEKQPRLKLTTTKGKNAGKSRLVPVPIEFVKELGDYLKYYRNPILKKNGIDHDYLFVTTRGNRLRAKRISDHFREVRCFAGLRKSDASPHLCRNRFITLHVKERLASLKGNRPVITP